MKDWYTLRCVCKKWNHILKNPVFWDDVDLSSLYNQLYSKNLSYALFACNNTTRLTLKGCWRLVNDDLLTIATLCPHLAALNISNCWSISDPGIQHIASKCNRLKVLNMSFCNQVKGACFSNHQMNGLLKIDISYCKQIGNECLEQLLAKAPELQEIKFRRCIR